MRDERSSTEPPPDPRSGDEGPGVGLCARCRWQRVQANRRGGVFHRCARAESEPRFLRYPPLPVLRCPGFDERETAARPSR